ncbi:MAG: endonuclease domain-containing protein [Erythrobacter sp.]|nr:endonuclease domain-containing protein [Erythrobacter sp.]
MKTYRNSPSGTVDRARELRRSSTEAEKKLWRELRRVFPAATFRRQSPVGPFFADFLSFKHKLIVEVDGGQHDEHRHADARRTAFLEGEGFQVIRFWNDDVLQNADGVLQVIASHLQADGGE